MEKLKKYSAPDDKLKLAKYIAEDVFHQQVDKGGHPYMGHIQRVVDGVETHEQKIVAYLHDVVEDTWVTMDHLREFGFSEDILRAVKLVTKSKKKDYISYIKDISQDDLAKAVKISDLKDNSDVTRLKTIRENDLKRLQKYKYTLEFLTGQIPYESFKSGILSLVFALSIFIGQ